MGLLCYAVNKPVVLLADKINEILNTNIQIKSVFFVGKYFCFPVEYIFQKKFGATLFAYWEVNHLNAVTRKFAF